LHEREKCETKFAGGRGREGDEEEEESNKMTVRPQGSSGSVYDRPRVPPKIRRPVPLNERDKYDYTAKPGQPAPSAPTTTTTTAAPTTTTTTSPSQEDLEEDDEEYYDDEEYDDEPPKRKYKSDYDPPSGETILSLISCCLAHTSPVNPHLPFYVHFFND
jgi:hypothetical protein